MTLNELNQKLFIIYMVNMTKYRGTCQFLIGIVSMISIEVHPELNRKPLNGKHLSYHRAMYKYIFLVTVMILGYLLSHNISKIKNEYVNNCLTNKKKLFL